MTIEANVLRCDGLGCTAGVPMKAEPPLSEQQKVQLAGFADGMGWLVVGERHYCPGCKDDASRPKLGF
jgi:hypothetical protein